MTKGDVFLFFESYRFLPIRHLHFMYAIVDIFTV